MEFRKLSALKFFSKATGGTVTITPNELESIVIQTNQYLRNLKVTFTAVEADIFAILEQRNLSGFIGEVFAKIFCSKIAGFKNNPHADGRPDMIDLGSSQSNDFFENNCFSYNSDGSRSPKRDLLNPFPYGGLEVKCSIGAFTNYKEDLFKDTGRSNFEIGIPRIKYISGITYWGHHTGCDNLLGLYYDYYWGANFVPQVLAVMHSHLVPATDWNPVSVGSKGSKKTSNTSLTAVGREKLLRNSLLVIDDDEYLGKLRSIGLRI